MKKPFILSEDKLEEQRLLAANKNPNKERIDAIHLEMRALSTELHSLLSETEKYCNLMLALANFDHKDKAASFMSNEEICSHMISLFEEHTQNDMDRAILDEALARLGWPFEEDEK